MSFVLAQHHLVTARIEELRPTQFSVGYAEVKAKRQQWAELSKKKRKELLRSHVFPTVIGPKGRHYVIDHHHLGIALLEEGVAHAWLAIMDDLSWLAPNVFWRTLEFRRWTYPYDARGQRVPFVNIPKKLTDLQDDPYRSLAGLVRSAGGFAKDNTPFAEFIWADYFRERIDATQMKRSMRQVVTKAVELARHAEARYLPGWSGVNP